MHKCSQTHSVQQHALTHTQGIPQALYARSWSGQVHSQVTVLRRCLLGRCYTAHQPTPGTATCTSLVCSCHPTCTFSKLSHTEGCMFSRDDQSKNWLTNVKTWTGTPVHDLLTIAKDGCESPAIASIPLSPSHNHNYCPK